MILRGLNKCPYSMEYSATDILIKEKVEDMRKQVPHVDFSKHTC